MNDQECHAERTEKGRAAEAAAALEYERLGYVIVAKNWRFHRMAELDLVVRRIGNPGLLVFCEVKYRADTSFEPPSAAVGRQKQQKIRLAAEGFLSCHAEYREDDIRFDVAEVSGCVSDTLCVSLLERAF